MSTTVKVELNHIAAGAAVGSLHCPIEWAVMGVVREGVRVNVGNESLSLAVDQRDQLFWLPAAITAWITRFDAVKPVGPIEFDLDIEREFLP
jgi:hypothetical protein